MSKRHFFSSQIVKGKQTVLCITDEIPNSHTPTLKRERERERAERVKILKFSVSFIYSFNFQCLAVVFFVHTLKIGCHKKKIYAKTTGELCKLFQPNKLIIFFVNYDHFLARYYYVENLAQCFQWVLQDIALSAL